MILMKKGMTNLIIDYFVFRTFGCTAFSHLNEEKLEPRFWKCIFLGYVEGVKDYTLWDRRQNEVIIIVSWDITFNEAEMLGLKSNSEFLGEKSKMKA